ncbi:MAG: G/T mismatches repair enzyme [Methanomethylovorans sp. PtaU1.Bin093]|uniref:endonuclease III n=1 Tax=Methanomethylovorans sp. PtaU1.Bin093 TaxID=1811679 RepID=UPI0009D28123|nr:endonuclease III [Methanomethylovorans sp. PtaU1.Bin093]OPY20985.1 MAG: G/T mismatches repair enzyme [Methanomethylovorans sp. PtaU1.Bin093]
MNAEENIPDNTHNFENIFSLLRQVYPDAAPALHFSSPLELLIATILSAQCTDRQVNQVTQSLFRKYRTLEDYAAADVSAFEKEIYSTGFYHQKAKHIIESAQIMLWDFGGKVPDTMEGLLQLPGVGRKTANIVLSRAFGKIEGIAVDTHVKRLSNRLGFTQSEDPEKIEKDLMRITKREDLETLSMTLILHGRNVCVARNPKCVECVVKELCPSSRV